MRAVLGCLGIWIMGLFLSACGPILETDHYADMGGQRGPAGKGVVILPFADYSTHSNAYGYWRRNALIWEALRENITEGGLDLAEQEEVIRYLIHREIIKVTGTSKNVVSGTLQNELSEDWSFQMRGDIEKAILKNLTNDPRSGVRSDDNQRLRPLDTQMIKDLGKTFGAHYVIRGRIMEFEIRQREPYYPFQDPLSFFFRLPEGLIFGEAQSETYESMDKVDPGGLQDIYVGEKQRPALYGGVVYKPLVRVTMIAHDGATGNEIWRETAEVTAYGVISFMDTASPTEKDIPVNQAVRKATRDLLKSFLGLTKAREQAS